MCGGKRANGDGLDIGAPLPQYSGPAAQRPSGPAAQRPSGMTCARRGVGAHRPAASAPSRSPSPRRTQPEDRSRPDPRGRRARLSLLLPVLALLLGAVGLFAAAPAQAQTTVWTATLTVGQSPGQNEWGCGGSGGLGLCSSSLSDDDFEFGGKTYSFTGLIVFGSSADRVTHNMFLRFSGINGRQAKSALSALTLQVGTGSDARTYAFSDAAADGVDIRWASPPRWSKGDTVPLKLTAPAAKPAKPTGLEAKPGDAQVTLSWKDASDSSITKHQYQQKAGNAEWGTTWTGIPNSAPGETNATSYTIPHLSNGTAYWFRLRAVNAAGNSPQSDEAGPVTPERNVAPTLTVGGIPGGVAKSKPVTVTVSDGNVADELTAAYRLIDATNQCVFSTKPWTDIELSDTPADDGNTKAGRVILASEAHNGKYLCVRVDDGAGSTVLVASGQISGLDTTAPSIAFPSKGAAATPKVQVASTITLRDTPAKVAKYAVVEVPGSASDATGCDDPSASGDDFTTTAVSPAVATKEVSYTPVTAGTKICAYAEDAVGNSRSELWSTPIEVPAETVPPTVTANKTGYFSDATVSNALTGPLKAGADIYTKLTFSEDMKHEKSDKAAARPELFRSIGMTDTQYHIVDNGDTLSSGDCKPNHRSETDEYVCLYTVASGDNGAFRIKVGTKSVDLADNALANEYAHAATLTLDTAAPTVSTVAIASDPGDDDTYKTGDQIKVAVTFTEPVRVTGTPRLFLKVGDNNRRADYASGSGTATLTFSYTVAADEEDTDGVSVPENAFLIGPSQKIEDALGHRADTSHDALAAQSGHKVDAVKPSAPSAVVLASGTTSPGTDSTPSIEVTVPEAGGKVTLYYEPTCWEGYPAASDATDVTDTEAPYKVTVTAKELPRSGTFPFYARYSDKAGNPSDCSTAFASYDYTAPNADPVVTVGAVPGGAAKSKSVTVTVTDTDAGDSFTAHYRLIDGSTCDATTYGSEAGTAVTLGNTAAEDGNTQEGTIALGSETANGKYLCVKAGDGTATVYKGSAQIGGIDTTAPTVSSAGYYSNAAATTTLTGPVKGGVAVYTKVTFSEDVQHVKSDEAAARPELFYRIGNSDTQYDILNNADTLATGDCKPTHASETDEYVCLYTVGTSDSGSFTVKAGTNSADKVGNALASEYTHDTTLTLDNTVPAMPSALALASGTASPGNDATPEIEVTVGETGGTVTLYSDNACTSAASAAKAVTDTETPFKVTVPATALTTDGSVTFHAWHADAAQNASDCSDASVAYVYDGTDPGIAFPDGVTPTVGTAATITLTDATA
ncbi:MAG: fibronectin type III domain-containing protein, partial [Boseongicola sp. SB0677_bin_26]|nr:fibronectin type III domain-containing protein [Boseongicola sp. SB0677_bin_26]